MIKNSKLYGKILMILGALFILTAVLTACSASQQESNTTYYNREKINAAIPVPDLSFSTRRLVLAKYYLTLERPRLNTCTSITTRGVSDGGGAIFNSFGPSVNLSNQMTSGTMSEPDSVYVGPNDQTLAVLRNGNFVTTEADMTTVGGDCPAGVKIDSSLQKMIDNAAGIKPDFDFTNTDGLKVGGKK